MHCDKSWLVSWWSDKSIKVTFLMIDVMMCCLIILDCRSENKPHLETSPRTLVVFWHFLHNELEVTEYLALINTWPCLSAVCALWHSFFTSLYLLVLVHVTHISICVELHWMLSCSTNLSQKCALLSPSLQFLFSISSQWYFSSNGS